MALTFCAGTFTIMCKFPSCGLIKHRQVRFHSSRSQVIHRTRRKKVSGMDRSSKSAPEQHICVGLLAHVDAGKTTLSEAMLYETGRLKRLGRVDHQDAFLDTHSLERARGITIFSKQARLQAGTLALTPFGHPGTRGFLGGDGAHPSGAGLRDFGHQRHRRRPGSYGNPVGNCCAGTTSLPFSFSIKWTWLEPAGTASWGS